MEQPAPKDLAHDLRNLLGLVRAVGADLVAQLGPRGGELGALADDLDRYTRFALDALRVVEKWEEPSAIDVHLGAWAWALRLRHRALRVGELAAAGRAKLVVPEALAAGVELLEGIGGGRAVSVELDQGALMFEAMGRAADAVRLEAASARLRELGLKVSTVSQLPCRVAIAAA